MSADGPYYWSGDIEGVKICRKTEIKTRGGSLASVRHFLLGPNTGKTNIIKNDQEC